MSLRPFSRPPARQRGFTIVELMIAVAIGLMILAGMTTLFVNNSRTQGEIEKSNRQVENGRYGIEIISSDLGNAGFYGEFDPTPLATPPAPSDPCALTVALLKEALPFHVQGVDDAASGALSTCLTGGVRAGTDILVVRHAHPCVAGSSGCDTIADGGPYFQASLCNNPTELNSGNPATYFDLDVDTAQLTRHLRNCTQVAGSGTLASIRRYDLHIYFVADNDNSGDGIPTLKRAELTSSGGALSFVIVPLVEGIDNLQLEYGIDINNDGAPDLYSADPATANGCALPACAADNWRNAITVKVNLLARNLEKSVEYTDSKSYVLGNDADGTPHTVAAAGDHYKRHVFQAVVNLPNPRGRKLP